MQLEQKDLDYFARGEWQNPQFWRRFGGAPDFRNTRVLDVGCGHGSMALYVAQADAARVVGLDLNCKLIDFARENLRQNYPRFAHRVEFHCQNLTDFPEGEQFDYILSKDSFEHIMDLPGMLEEMRKRLTPGGEIYAGFGPLYNSPFGDHGYANSRIPWRHLMLGERRLVEGVNKRWRTDRFQCLEDLGLNGLSLADYERIFAESGLEIIGFHRNRSEKLYAKLFSLLAHIPAFREYFVFNIYVILRKPVR